MYSKLFILIMLLFPAISMADNQGLRASGLKNASDLKNKFERQVQLLKEKKGNPDALITVMQGIREYNQRKYPFINKIPESKLKQFIISKFHRSDSAEAFLFDKQKRQESIFGIIFSNNEPSEFRKIYEELCKELGEEIVKKRIIDFIKRSDNKFEGYPQVNNVHKIVDRDMFLKLQKNVGTSCKDIFSNEK